MNRRTTIGKQDYSLLPETDHPFSQRTSRQSINRQTMVMVDRKQSDLKKWKIFQEQTNAKFHSTQTRIGVYLEFLEFLSQRKRKDLSESSSKVTFKAVVGEAEIVEKYQLLKEVAQKVNEKVQVLEQKANSALVVFESGTNDYFDQLAQKTHHCESLAELSEKEVLLEIELNIDINKEEEAIEAFIRERNFPMFSIYQLKSKIMNEKIQRIKSSIDTQSSALLAIRTTFSHEVASIANELLELRQIIQVDTS